MHYENDLRRWLFCALAVVGLSTVGAGAETGKWTRHDVDWKGPGGTRIRSVYRPSEHIPAARGPRSGEKFYRKTLPPQAAVRLQGESTTGAPLQALVIDSPPIAGFVPWVAVTATNRRSGELEMDAIPYTSVVGTYLTTDPQNNYAIGLLDTGAGVSVVGNAAAHTLGLFSGSPNYITGSTIEITGVTGSVDAWVSQPFGLFVDGLGAIDPVSGLLSTAGMVGEGNLSVAVGQPPAPGAPDLPTVIGAPMAVYFASVIHNDQRLTVTRNGDAFIGPNIEFFDAYDPNVPEYPIFVPLELRPLGGASVMYIPCLDPYGGCPSEFGDPETPSLIIGVSAQSLFFVSSVDLYDGAYSAIDRHRFMLDTGAQVSVVGNRIAALLALDINNPDFIVDIQGVSGDITQEKGFYLDSVEIPALGEWLSFTNVPVVLLDVASPEGGTLDGIIGMNLFIHYKMVMRGGGLSGMADPSLEVEFMPPIPGDFNGDGYVDLEDFAIFEACFSGEDVPHDGSALCQQADFDDDDYVDCDDFDVFVSAWTGPPEDPPAFAPCMPISLLGAVSRIMHGAAGEFDLELPVGTSAEAGVECRTGGPTQIVLTFSGPADGVSIQTSAGSVDALVVDGDQAIVELSGVPDSTCLTLTVHRAAGVEGDREVYIQVLAGDVNGDGVVNITDLSTVRSNLYQTLSPANFLSDVNVDGVINITDLSIIKSNLYATASCPE